MSSRVPGRVVSCAGPILGVVVVHLYSETCARALSVKPGEQKGMPLLIQDAWKVVVSLVVEPSLSNVHLVTVPAATVHSLAT